MSQGRSMNSDNSPSNTWSPPDVGGDGSQVVGRITSEDVSGYALPPMPTAKQFEAWEREGREAGYREGYAAGFDKGRTEALEEGRQTMQRLGQIMAHLQAPLKDCNEETEEELLRLCLAIAQQMVRREIQVNPGEIIPLIRETLALVPSHAISTTLHVHPDDARLIRELLAPAEGGTQWSLKEDPLITPGGCYVETEKSRIDATLESRLKALAASVLAGARASD